MQFGHFDDMRKEYVDLEGFSFAALVDQFQVVEFACLPQRNKTGQLRPQAVLLAVEYGIPQAVAAVYLRTGVRTESQGAEVHCPRCHPGPELKNLRFP